MDIIINEELKAYIDPLTPEEHEALERSILAEGCRDALILWGDVLVDGHNRYGICVRHGIPFQTLQHPLFKSLEDVHLWMIDQHLGRRSVSDFQRGLLALRKKEIITERRARLLAEGAQQSASADEAAPDTAPAGAPADGQAPWEGSSSLAPLNSREAIARAARLSTAQVQQIEKIQKQAAPELVAAVRAGSISLNAAATVATLPVDEQQAAVAGGKEELKQAAKRVRQSRSKPRDAAPAEAAAEGENATDAPLNGQGLPPVTAAAATEAQIRALQERIQALEAENAQLRAALAQAQAA